MTAASIREKGGTEGEFTPTHTRQGPFQATPTCQEGGESLAPGRRTHTGQEARVEGGVPQGQPTFRVTGLFLGWRRGDLRVLRGGPGWGRHEVLSLKGNSSACTRMRCAF